MEYIISSTDLALLSEARTIAREYAETKKTKNTIGIVFLGAIARGYFDHDSDIDIAFFEDDLAHVFDTQTIRHNNFDLQYFYLDINNEKNIMWEMGKRWAYSSVEIYYDTDNKVQNLINSKTHISKDERRQLLMQGMALSEWYCNRLVTTWIKRGSITSAHYMFNEGINHLLSAIYIYNNQLVADYKWRVFCIEGLKYKPKDLTSSLEKLMTIKEISNQELERRREIFLLLWREMLLLVEEELQMKYDEFVNKV